MAYNQGYYQASQRPYDGHGGPPSQQSYQQDYSYGKDQYNNGYPQQDYSYNGYGQDYPPENNYNQDQRPMRRGPPQHQGAQWQQNQGYPPQQDMYNGGGNQRPQNGGGRGGRGGAPYGRPPTADSMRGGFDNRGGGGGYPPGRGGRGGGRGGRPPPLDRSASSDPGAHNGGRPRVAPDQLSPTELPWDNPFPGFPGAKKKTAKSEEQQLMQKMSNMDINDPRRQNSAGSRGPSRGPANNDGYGRPSGESQRSGPPKGAAQGYGSPSGEIERPRPGPGPGAGYGPPVRQNTYDPSYNQSYPPTSMGDGFGPPSRSNTMPNDMSGSGQPPNFGPGAVGPSAPYNGPVGRAPGPQRPATATGNPPQRQYTSPEPPLQPPPPQNDNRSPPAHSHKKGESISDLYDSYYDPAPQSDGRPQSDRDNAIPPRQQVQGFQTLSHTKSQPDFRAQAQPQSAAYEMAPDAPPMPNGGFRQGYPDQNYDGYDNSYDQGQSDFGQPQRHGSGNSRPPGPPGRGVGLPNGPSPQARGMDAVPPRMNGPPAQNGPNMNSSHPVPVRAGLIPNSVANQANNKPIPVRNYGGTPSQPPPPQIQPQSQPQNNVAAAPQLAPKVTQEELARLQMMIKANPNDQTSQLLLAQKWIEAADVLVPQIPDQKSRAKAREKYNFDAHKMLKKLVAAQNAEAMFILADCHSRGSLGLEADNKEAFTLYQSAAKAGHAASAYRTAVCCELGNDEGGGTRKDPLKAIQWYKRAAMLGDTPAMYKMGMIQLKGLLGQPKNPREAIQWLKRAADRADADNPHALHELGLLYEAQQPPDGSSGIIRDEAYSFSLFKQAADMGYKFSQFKLGSAYEYGLFNLPIDPRLSIMWYSRAAVQEEHQSELALSGWYLTGSEGVLQQSDTEAYLWARKAAMAGLAKAEYAMGYFNEVGVGSPADLEAAKRWYWRASAQNFPKARERLEDLKRGGPRGQQLRSRERVSRSKIGKQNEGECAVM